MKTIRLIFVYIKKVYVYISQNRSRRRNVVLFVLNNRFQCVQSPQCGDISATINRRTIVTNMYMLLQP